MTRVGAWFGMAAVVLVALLPAAIALDDAAAPLAPAAAASPGTTATTMSTTVPTTTAGPSTVTTAAPSTTSTPALPASSSGAPWFELADCESGTWVRHADGSITFVAGSADWSTSDGVHEGGLQFAPSTWDGNKPAGYPDGAHHATVEQQIAVAEVVLARYGPSQWPTCGPMVGLR